MELHADADGGDREYSGRDRSALEGQHRRVVLDLGAG
jgi:hypothetical protein